jgi:hypothetical protein
VILGLDFLKKTRMLVDVAARQFSFGFAPECRGVFVKGSPVGETEPFWQNLCDEALNREVMPEVWPSGVSSSSFMADFPKLFSSVLGETSCAPYEIKLSDPTPVRSPPYRCAPPKLAIFREKVNELLEQGVVRPSKSPYASPAFRVPKSGGVFRMPVYYRKVTAKVNTAIHESTKCTPVRLFLGREIKCPLDVRWDLSLENAADTGKANQAFWTQAHRNLKLACKRVARRYNRDRKPHRYQVGDTVMYRLNLVSLKGQNIYAKLLLRWSRPVVVARIVRPNVVLLADPDTGVVVRRAHVSQLKPYVK